MHLLMFVAKQSEQIRVSVVNGQRPDLSVITGPDQTLLELTVDLIERCWHQTPDERPTFSGILFFYEKKNDIYKVSYSSYIIQQ